ncbi:MAG: DUF5331 domain-containing protein [Crocosphaera sp.]|nr:DUF5331 domain-containing protein [Crocosphaera sp.]
MSYSEEFDEFKVRLKDQWLDYYEANQDWINPLLNYHSDWEYIKNDQHRPPYYMILTALAYQESKLKEWLPLLCQFRQNGSEIIKNLELNFDPKIEIEKRSNQCYQIQRLSYFLLVQKPIKILNFSIILALTFIPNAILRNSLEKLAIFESIAYELIELEKTETISYESETYLDSNTQYLNEIRTKIKQGEL